MIGSEEDFGAYIYIHQNDSGTVILEGAAYYGYNIGEFSGIVQIVDSCHFYAEDFGSRLDVIYNPDTQQLSVEESGDPLDGLNVTFSGNCAKKTGKLSDTSESVISEAEEIQNENPSDAVVAQLLSEWVPPFVGVPGDITFYWLEPRVVTAETSVQSALPEAFTVSGYVDMMMVQSTDGNWFTEVYDDYTTITYNYADEYLNYAETIGVVIESEVTAGNGYVAITVMPMDFTGIGTDPTRDPVVCFLEPYTDSTDADVEYRLWDGVGEVQVYLNSQMEPVAFQLNLS